jgi:Flp pilus assembly protein TadD
MAADQEQLATAIAHHQAGRPQQAYDIYRRLLAAEPESATLLSLLGAACIHLRQWEEGAAHLSRAIEVEPRHAAAHDNLGVLLAKQGRMGEAVESFERAATLNPNNVQTQMNLAAALVRTNRPQEAIEAYRKAAELAPGTQKVHAELARLLSEAGRSTEAVPHFRQLARLNPADPKARFELAAALALAGQTSEAISTYQETLELAPESAETCVNLAQLCCEKRQYEQALVWAQRAVQMRPQFAEAHINLGSALEKLERLDEAQAALEEAVRLKPEMSEAYNNLGIVLMGQERFSEARGQFLRALELNPRSPDTLYNLGLVVLREGQQERAIEWFDQALRLAPQYAEARHNRSAALLQLGRFDEGLPEYEWRFRSRDFPPFRPRWKLWDGSDPRGRTIVLVAEQGLGDTLQFVRYAPLLAERGATVLVECAASLHPILARTPGVARLLAPAETGQADACVPMMSLPHRFGTTLATIPRSVPYLFADEARVEAWRGDLAAHEGFKVGIAWQGNPLAPLDRERSMPLACFEPLATTPGVRLFSLQKGDGADQLRGVADAWPIVDFGERLDAGGGAFMDTAAIMRNLDLVVTSDTAIAHLAGGLGVPVWVALQAVPDWRWLLEREDCPWYPTMRLFRQRTRGDWAEVFARVAEELARHVAATRR